MFRLLIRLKRMLKRKLGFSKVVRNGEFPKNKYLYKAILILAVTLLITLAYPQQLVFQPVELPRLGDIAHNDVIAPFDFEVMRPQEQVEKDIEETMANLPLILDYDFVSYENTYRREVSFFGQVRQLKHGRVTLAQGVDSLKKFMPDLNIAILRELLRSRDLDLIENKGLNAIETVYVNGVLSDTVDLSKTDYKRAIIRKKAEEIEIATDSLMTVAEAIAKTRRMSEAESIPGFSARSFTELVAAFVNSNLAVNLTATNLNKKNALAAIPYSERAYKAGDLVVKRNTRVDGWHIRALEALTEKRIISGEEGSAWQLILPYLGRGAIILFTLAILAVFLAIYKSRMVFTNQRFTALMLIVVMETFLVYLIDYKLNLSVYLIPFAIGPILITVLFDLETGLISTLAIALIMGVIQNFNFSIALLSFLAGTTAAVSVVEVNRRSDFYRSVLYLVILYLVATYLMESLKFSSAETIVRELGYGLINAIISPLIAMGILPIFETGFSITTDLTLLELSDMNHPLLRRLALEAPGTYHHSIVVGNLCEKAAKAIHANPLLARVGAYYHDIGKIEIPEYFIENLSGNKSKHDSLNPSMSALIISSHVKKGLELAEAEDLPDTIMEFIVEHHGTSVMDYFYHKAKEMSGENDDEVSESEYRYPGPRPQSKETAILMIADSVEAASRTLDDPKPSRVRNLVHKLINDKFQSGQLSDSVLTLRDLAIMEDAFTQMILAIFHGRIDYPQKEAENEN